MVFLKKQVTFTAYLNHRHIVVRILHCKVVESNRYSQIWYIYTNFHVIGLDMLYCTT